MGYSTFLSLSFLTYIVYMKLLSSGLKFYFLLRACVPKISLSSLELYAYTRLVYKIPYRRAPRLAYRRRASKGILHTNTRSNG